MTLHATARWCRCRLTPDRPRIDGAWFQRLKLNMMKRSHTLPRIQFAPLRNGKVCRSFARAGFRQCKFASDFWQGLQSCHCQLNTST